MVEAPIVGGQDATATRLPSLAPTAPPEPRRRGRGAPSRETLATTVAHVIARRVGDGL